MKNSVDRIIKSYKITKKDTIIIISGNASGADSLGERYAKENNYKLRVMPADWNKYGKKAGPIRNEDMAIYASKDNDKCLGILIVFWNGISRGTLSMIQLGYKYKLDTNIIKY